METDGKKTRCGGQKRSSCPIAGALDIVGDRWTLLVVRDLLFGRSTYGELQKSPEKIPTNILADRLKRLEEAGIVSKASYQKRPVRYAYRLTEKGLALGTLLKAMVEWGNRYVPGTAVPDDPDSLFAPPADT